jgi:hypothetical protein
MSSPSSPLKLAWRVPWPRYETDAAFNRVLDFFIANRDVVDEVALFDNIYHHNYFTVEDEAYRAGRAGECMRRLREAGFTRVGINVISTIGHRDEAWDFMQKQPFQGMVGHDGKTSTGCACPNTPELRAYVVERYQMLARQSPDFLWVDDDLRYHHHGVNWPCFCETCLGLFASRTGVRRGRVELVAALNDPQRGDVRAAWVEFNVSTLQSLLADIARAVHDLNPAIETGLMTVGPGWTTYAGQAFDRWFPALEAVRARPGGGFYSDFDRMGLIEKVMETGRQLADIPAEVTDLQYELENFPYQALNKATRTTLNECVMVLGLGLNGILLNAVSWRDGSLQEYEPIAAGMRANRAGWEELVRHSHDLPTVGFWTAWNDQITARRTLRPGEDWFAWDHRYHFMDTHALAHIGLPVRVHRQGEGTVLFGRVADAFSDAELRKILSGGVLMDSEALLVLEERGLADLAGARVSQRMTNGMMEQFSADALNGKYAGEYRDMRTEVGGATDPGNADLLEPLSDSTRVLAIMMTFFYKMVGPCLTAYENELGGRVVVMGYLPWRNLGSYAKRTQLVNIADWVLRGTTPVRIMETVTVTPLVKMSPERDRGAILLLNNGLETVERVTLQVRMQPARVRLVTTQGETVLETKAEPGGWSVELQQLEAWSVTILLVG